MESVLDLPVCVTLVGWAGNYNSLEHSPTCMRFLRRGFSSRDAWLSGGQKLFWPHSLTTVNLMARGHTTALKTHLYVYSNDGSGRSNGCFPSSSQRKPAGQRSDRLLEEKIAQLVDVSRRNSTGTSEDTARDKSRELRYSVQLPLKKSEVPYVGPREVNTWG